MRKAREKAGDDRLSLAERYTSRKDYLERVTRSAQDLVRERFLLPGDFTRGRPASRADVVGRRGRRAVTTICAVSPRNTRGREVREDDHDGHEHQTCHAHHARVRHGPSAFRLQAGDRSKPRNDDGEDEPGQPGHV